MSLNWFLFILFVQCVQFIWWCTLYISRSTVAILCYAHFYLIDFWNWIGKFSVIVKSGSHKMRANIQNSSNKCVKSWPSRFVKCVFRVTKLNLFYHFVIIIRIAPPKRFATIFIEFIYGCWAIVIPCFRFITFIRRFVVMLSVCAIL